MKDAVATAEAGSANSAPSPRNCPLRLRILVVFGSPAGPKYLLRNPIYDRATIFPSSPRPMIPNEEIGFILQKSPFFNLCLNISYFSIFGCRFIIDLILTICRIARSRRATARDSYRFSLASSGNALRTASAVRSGSSLALWPRGRCVLAWRVATCPIKWI